MAETFKSSRPRTPRLSAEGREPSSAQQCPAAPSSHRQTSALPQTAHFPAGLHPEPQPLLLLYHIVRTASESTGTAAVLPRSTPRSPSTGSRLSPALPRWPGCRTGHGHPAVELSPAGERPRKPHAVQPWQTHLSSAGSSCSALPTAWKGSREGLRGHARLRDGEPDTAAQRRQPARQREAGDSTALSGSVMY